MLGDSSKLRKIVSEGYPTFLFSRHVPTFSDISLFKLIWGGGSTILISAPSRLIDSRRALMLLQDTQRNIWQVGSKGTYYELNSKDIFLQSLIVCAYRFYVFTSFGRVEWRLFTLLVHRFVNQLFETSVISVSVKILFFDVFINYIY